MKGYDLGGEEIDLVRKVITWMGQLSFCSC